MRKLIDVAVLVALSLPVMVACENKDQPANAQTVAPATAPPNPNLTGATINVDPIANAANRTRVQEHSDDVRLNPPKEAQLITGFAARVRESPSGEAISTVETKANVTEVAHDRSGDYYLVLYADAKNPGKQEAGWVNKNALEDTGVVLDYGVERGRSKEIRQLPSGRIPRPDEPRLLREDLPGRHGLRQGHGSGLRRPRLPSRYRWQALECTVLHRLAERRRPRERARREQTAQPMRGMDTRSSPARA